MKTRIAGEKSTKLGLPLQLRLDPKIEEEIEKIVEHTGLAKVEVIRQCAAAGARAIARNGYKMTLPLQLEVSNQVEENKKAPARTAEALGRDPVVKGSRLS